MKRDYIVLCLLLLHVLLVTAAGHYQLGEQQSAVGPNSSSDMGRQYYLLELHNMWMYQTAVVDDLTLNIFCHLHKSRRGPEQGAGPLLVHSRG
jgi:hypothetical protein